MKLFRSYIVCTLALLITLSATGLSISLHKCCGSIKDFSLFGTTQECKMANKPALRKCPVKPGSAVKKDSCCQNQRISLTQTANKNLPATKAQVKEKEQSFDVLFVYSLFKNWLGSSDKEEESESPSPGVFIVEALILLLQQFRI